MMVTVPHRINRAETSTRLLIATMFQARPDMTRRDLAAFFHVSLRTVTDALRQPAECWVDRLIATPESVHPARSRFTISRKSTPSMMKRPGSRARATLVEPEATVEYTEQVDFDVPEPVIDDDAIERAINKALDDYDDQVRMTPETIAKKKRDERNGA